MRKKKSTDFMIKNPILSGFYPDPSICKAGEDYYLVTSSFSYFPGVPVFHSRDLCHWEQIGHVLDRPEQVHMTYEDISGGIFAPDISYHKGVFYLITTNVTTHETFICTAKDPAGPWSAPNIVEGAGGIDPSLFFDDDGTCYFTGTSPMGSELFANQAILLGTLDLETFQIKGRQIAIGDGAMKNSYCPEGPHLYKRNGWYYLLIAEGGTEHFHSVTISRSKTITGPYENYIGNPILTHRHMGKEYPICNVGHADMVKLPDDSWYMVCLGSRLFDGYHKPLGRETFLMPVSWEDDWPVVSPGSGKVEEYYPAPSLVPWIPEQNKDNIIFGIEEGIPGDAGIRKGFGYDVLNMEWNVLGTPYENLYRLHEDVLFIKMSARSTVPWEYHNTEFDFLKQLQSAGNTRENVPFVGRRLTSPCFEAEVTLQVDPEAKQSAGIVLLQQGSNQIRMECLRNADYTQNIIRIIITRYYAENGGKQWFEEQVLAARNVGNNDMFKFFVKGERTRFSFYAYCGEGIYRAIAENVDGSFLGSETCGGFVGTYFGMFASGNGTETEKEAAFSDFVWRAVSQK